MATIIAPSSSNRFWPGLLAPLAALALVACSPAAAATKSQAALGKQQYAYCMQCHMPSGGGSRLANAPNIAGLQDWYVKEQIEDFQDGARGGNPDDTQGLRMRPMSRLLTSTADIEAVAAYVSNLPPVQRPPTLGGDIAAGQTTFQQSCASCHGADAMGNEAMGAPRLAGRADWYVARQLDNFRAGIRGTDPRDPHAELMRTIAVTLPNEQAIDNVAAYVASLK